MNPGWQQRSKHQTMILIRENHEEPEAPTRFEIISAFAELSPKARRLEVPIVRFTAGIRSPSHYTAK
jgi:hypothetical protein